MLTVDVVIPTILRDREKLDRAVRSALQQSRPPHQVLVVVDDSAKEIPEFEDARVVAFLNTTGKGAAAARNAGVRRATADLVAFLDDDDFWLPSKLALQVPIYRAQGPNCVVTSRARVEGPQGQQLIPDRPLRPGESLVDYLFPAPGLRRSPNSTVPTPTLLAPRALLEEEPFNEALRQWEDVEWLLRVADLDNSLCWASETLVVVDQLSTGESLSQESWPELDEQWADTYLADRSRRAWQVHLLTYAVRGFGQKGERLRALRLMCRAVRAGRAPTPLVLKALSGVMIPTGAYRVLKGRRRR